MNENSMPSKPKDSWASGEDYERYVGRWSRLVAHEFLKWLAIPAGSQWLDVGCGTGALSQTILQFAEPAKIKGIDRSEGFVALARVNAKDNRVQFDVGDAESLTADSGTFDIAVSGLVLNFIPQPERAAASGGAWPVDRGDVGRRNVHRQWLFADLGHRDLQ